MDFMERVAGMFTRPEETIKDILKEPRIEEPLVIIGVYGVLLAISSVLSTMHNGGGISVLSAVTGLIMAFIGWLIATGVVHVFATFLGGQGKINPDLLNTLGYTYIVKYIPVIIGLFLIFLTPVVQIPSQPNVTAGMSMDQVKEAMQPYITLMEQTYFNPIFILSLVISFLGLVWSCYLGTLAVKNAYKLSQMSSYIAVFVPMVIYIVMDLLLVYGSYLLIKMFYG